jgi:hypothetical protein
MEANGDVATIGSETTILIKCDHLNNINGGNLLWEGLNRRYSAGSMDG